MHDPARQQHQDEQRRQAVGVGGAAVEIELEAAEQRRHRDALQAVGTTGDVGQRVGELAHHQRDAQRHHQPREIAAAQHEEAGEEAQHGRRRCCEREAGERIAGDVLGQQAGRIGAEAEEGRVPQRDDAGVTQDQIEREREQRQDRDLVQDQMLARGQEQRAEGEQPEDALQPSASAPALPGCAARPASARRARTGRAGAAPARRS